MDVDMDDEKKTLIDEAKTLGVHDEMLSAMQSWDVATLRQVVQLKRDLSASERKVVASERGKCAAEQKASELEQKVRVVEEEKGELAQKVRKLEHENSTVKQEKGELAEKVRVVEQTLRSVENTVAIKAAYGSSNEDLKLLKILMNEGVVPSVQRKPKCSVEVTINRTYANENFGGMAVDIRDIKIPVKKSSDEIIASSLSVFADDWDESRQGFDYVNEAQVQNLCLQMIQDALRCLGQKTNIVMAHLEVTIDTMRPDIVLVLRRFGRIIFVVEVKSPEITVGQVFDSKIVGGQIWSYLLALKAMGDKYPMGAVMTYNEIVLATLQNYSQGNNENDDDVDSQHFQRVVKDTKVRLSSGIRQDPIPQPTKSEVNCVVREDTPVKIVQCFTSTHKSLEDLRDVMRGDKLGNRNIVEVEDEDVEDEDVEVKKEVFYSQVYKEGMVFPCLLQAIQIALLKSDGAEEVVPSVESGKSLGQRLAFVVAENSFNWVQTKRSLTAIVELDKFPMKTAQKFYILGKLGEGNSAAVYLVCTQTGIVCAMKNYFVKVSSCGHNEDRDIQEAKYFESAESAVEEEHKRWQMLYIKRGWRTAPRHLGASPCLLMPYGRPLVHSESKEEVRRKTYVDNIPAIRKELKRFAKKGYMYHEYDVRWAHVLRDAGNKIFLCDLESLEEIPAGTTEDDAVWMQLQILLKPVVKEARLTNCLECLQNTELSELKSFILKNRCLQDLGLSRRGLKDHVGRLFRNKTKLEDLTAEAVVYLSVISFLKEDQSQTVGASPSSSSPDSKVPSRQSDNQTVSVSRSSDMEEPKRKRIRRT